MKSFNVNAYTQTRALVRVIVCSYFVLYKNISDPNVKLNTWQVVNLQEISKLKTIISGFVLPSAILNEVDEILEI